MEKTVWSAEVFVSDRRLQEGLDIQDLYLLQKRSGYW